MKYSTSKIDIAIWRKLHIRISFLNQKFEMLSIKTYGIILPKVFLQFKLYQDCYMTKERKKSIVIIFVYSISIQYKSILTIKGETNSAWVCFYGWENLIWKFHCFYFGIFLCGLLWKGLRYSFHRWIDFFNTINLSTKSI